MGRTLSTDEVKAFYDRFGVRQDGQAFYEDPATADLIIHAGFPDAHAVFEFGCGTGRFADLLLSEYLPPRCQYRAVDISSTMAQLASERLAHWGKRVVVEQTNGSKKVTASEATFDRFVVNYVLDLLSNEDIGELLREAHRVLIPGGLLCSVSLTHGLSIPSKVVDGVWQAVFRLNPKLLGGCRPIEMSDYLSDENWSIRYRNVVSRFGISSEIIVASCRHADGGNPSTSDKILNQSSPLW